MIFGTKKLIKNLTYLYDHNVQLIQYDGRSIQDDQIRKLNQREKMLMPFLSTNQNLKEFTVFKKSLNLSTVLDTYSILGLCIGLSSKIFDLKLAKGLSNITFLLSIIIN